VGLETDQARQARQQRPRRRRRPQRKGALRAASVAEASRPRRGILPRTRPRLHPRLRPGLERTGTAIRSTY
jgi:hypothetical protein